MFACLFVYMLCLMGSDVESSTQGPRGWEEGHLLCRCNFLCRKKLDIFKTYCPCYFPPQQFREPQRVLFRGPPLLLLGNYLLRTFARSPRRRF